MKTEALRGKARLCDLSQRFPRGIFATALMLIMMSSLFSSTLRAQTFYGSIIGSVTDPSGAFVPGATVTASNLGTNETKTVTTNKDGDYRFVDLAPADYRVEVEAATFKRFVQERVTVQVSNAVRVNATLEAGAATEVVEVTSAPPMLQTDSGTVGFQVEGTVVQDTPLNGRNPMNLLALAPGVIPEQSTAGAAAGNAGIHTYTNGWGNYSIGGGIANESAQYIDGATNNMLGGNNPGLVPTQDMVQEFKIESNAVNAEYGHFGGGVVNMATKSGTNAFHGSAYEYVRNTILNTNDYISNANNLPKSPFHQNQYGVIVGGPIKRDRAFFEFSWEQYSLHKASGNELVVPTQAMRGDVSGYGGAVLNHPVHDNSTKACPVVNYGQPGAPGFLATGQSFVPSSCFDPAANILKTFWAYPNQAPNAQGYNFVDQPVTGDDNHQYNTRIDYNLGAKQRIFGRYTYWHLQDIGEDDFKGRPGNNLPADFGATSNTTNSIVLGDSVTFSSNLVGDFRVAYQRLHFENYGSARGFNLSSLSPGYASLASQVSYKEIPTFAVIGPDNITGPWNIPVGANQADVQEDFSLNAGLTKIFGNHQFKFGLESMLRNHSGIGNNPKYAGESTFLNFVNGDEWASFMLGEFVSDQIQTIINTFSVNWSHGVYFTDTWRISPKFTLSAGIRWEYPGGIYEKKDRATVFLPGVVDSTGGTGAAGALPGTLALVNSPLYHSRDVSTVKYDLFAPRISFADSLTNSLVFRGGYGLSYLPPDMPTGLMAFNSATNAALTTSNNNPGAPSIFLTNPFPTPTNPATSTITAPTGRSDPHPSSLYYNQVVSAPVPNHSYPYMQQWNATISKQWRDNILTEASYVGSKGTKLPNSGLANGVSGSYTSISQLPNSAFSQGYKALSTMAPCSALGGEVVTVGQCLLPFPQYESVFNTGLNEGGQDYNALYLIAAKRFNNGGVLNVNYTFSKTQGDTDQPGFGGGGNWQNFNNPHGEKAIGSFDVRNRMIINYVLNLPFGRGQHYLDSGGVSNALAGGWQVNGITTFQSGFPYSFSYNTANTYLFYNSNSNDSPWGAGTARPDILSGCNLKTSGSWHQKFETNNFFNAACLVPAGTNSPTATQNDQQLMLFGNAPRNTDAVRSEFVNNFDFAASKSTQLHESINLLFRAEFFNLFNHPVFSNAGAELGGSGYDEVGQNPVVGNQRLVQLSLRLNF